MDRTDQDARSRYAAGKTRRRFLLALGTTSAVAVAGCNSNTDTATDTTLSEEPTATDGEATGTPNSGGGTDESSGVAALPREDQQRLQLATTTRERIQFSLPSGGN